MAVNLGAIQNTDSAGNSKKSAMEKMNEFLLKLSGVPAKEKLFFLQHLRVMLKAGISLSAALKTLAKQSANKKFSAILNDVSAKVENGVSFTESLRSYEKVFGELFINMIEAGELSGKLENVLDRLYIQTKKSYELRSKIKSAMTYPTVIVAAMLGIGAFLIIFIVPKLMSMFKEFDAELPLPTKILIFISDTIVNNAVMSAAVLVAAVFVIVRVLRTAKGKFIFQAALLKAPVLSPIIKKINIAQFARTISSLLKTDIMIIKTFQITASTMGNVHYRSSLDAMAEQIKKGGKISDVVSQYPKLFPPIVTQMVSVGEETGELDSILEELADFYEAEVDGIMENLPAIIEPLLILLLGVGAGGIAVAIIMPMYTLSSAV